MNEMGGSGELKLAAGIGAQRERVLCFCRMAVAVKSVDPAYCMCTNEARAPLRYDRLDHQFGPVNVVTKLCGSSLSLHRLRLLQQSLLKSSFH
jgi:hypothetical protein